MSSNLKLVHVKSATKTDEALAMEATSHHDGKPILRVASAHLANLRGGALPWWMPALLLERFSVKERMEALIDRPDIRQQITTTLTGYFPKSARRLSPEEQTTLILKTLESGDITEAKIENAFDVKVLVTYMDASRFWHLFREQMPWGDGSNEHRELVGALTELLLGNAILTHHAVLSAIKRKVWQESIPLALRADIDDALLDREKNNPGQPFLAKDILTIVGPKEIAEFIALTEIIGVMDAAEKSMGFEKPKPVEAPATPPAAEEPVQPPPAPTNPVDAAAPTEPPAPDQPPIPVPSSPARTVGSTPPPADDGSTDINVAEGELEEVGDGEEEGGENGDKTIVLDRNSLDVESLAAAAAAPAGKPADPIPSSPGTMTLDLLQKLNDLDQAGFKITPDPAMTSVQRDAIIALHGMLVLRVWPGNTLDTSDAQTLFVRTFAKPPMAERDIHGKPAETLDALFFTALTKMGKERQPLIKELRAAKAKQFPAVPPALPSSPSSVRLPPALPVAPIFAPPIAGRK